MQLVQDNYFHNEDYINHEIGWDIEVTLDYNSWASQDRYFVRRDWIAHGEQWDNYGAWVEGYDSHFQLNNQVFLEENWDDETHLVRTVSDFVIKSNKVRFDYEVIIRLNNRFLTRFFKTFSRILDILDNFRHFSRHLAEFVISDLKGFLHQLQTSFGYSNENVTVCTIPPLPNISDVKQFMDASRSPYMEQLCVNNWIIDLSKEGYNIIRFDEVFTSDGWSVKLDLYKK